MRIYWRIGNYGESDDNLIRAIIRYISYFYKIYKNSKFKIRIIIE